MAMRSYALEIVNAATDLELQDAVVDYGNWITNISPPQTIPLRSRARWGSEDGDWTGTGGHAVYTCAEGLVRFEWNNPYML